MALEHTCVVDDVMRRWPATIGVFITHRMGCVGCPIGCFHTVDDACREHGIDRVRFMSDLQAALPRDTDPSAEAAPPSEDATRLGPLPLRPPQARRAGAACEA